MGRDDDSSGSPSGLDEVLADYMRRVDEGELIDHSAFIAAHPNLADELRKYFSLVEVVNQAAADSDYSTQSQLLM